MARCDEGYLCSSCKLPVDTLPESLLYLRYILGEVPVEVLHRHPDCHVRCCPEVAQYILHPNFEPIVCEGVFAKANFDVKYRESEEARITAAWGKLYAAEVEGFSLLNFVGSNVVVTSGHDG